MGKRNRRRHGQYAREGAKRDAALIRDCITYAQALAALKAGHDADPDPDGQYADELGGAATCNSVETLGRLAILSAATPISLQAKARVVPLLLAHCHGVLEATEEAFLKRFADDVRCYLQPRIRPNRSAAERWGQ